MQFAFQFIECIYKNFEPSTSKQHETGLFYYKVNEAPEKYFRKQPKLEELFKHLSGQGKLLFLVDHSPIGFMDIAMKVTIGPNWQDLFSVIISAFRAPIFFAARLRFTTYSTTAEYCTP